MTPEQLDAIENRQAAAMWIGGPTAAFAQDTLLLVKALREAWAERDEALGDARLAECQLDEIVELVGSGGDGSAFGSVESLLCDLKERTEERDYERAVNARLCAALERIANPAAVGLAFHEEAVAIARRAL